MFSSTQEPITLFPINNNNTRCINASDPRSLGSGYEPTVHYIIISVHAVVIFISIVLNGAICHVYRKGRVRKISFNALLVNLAIADIVTCTGMIPFIAVSPIMLRKLDGSVADIVCTLTVGQFVFWIGNAVSIMTLSVISINRYVIINHSMTSWDALIRRQDTKLFMLIIPWVLGILLPIPNIFARKFEWCSTLCSRQWPDYINGAAYGITTVVIGYVLPIGIMFSTLIASIRTLWFKKVPEGSDIAVLRARRRVTVLLCTLVSVFFFWWTPFAVYWIISTATNVFPDGDAGYYNRTKVIYVVTLFSLINAAINPIIYGLKSDDFRQAIINNFSVNLRSRSTSVYSPLIPQADVDS